MPRSVGLPPLERRCYVERDQLRAELERLQGALRERLNRALAVPAPAPTPRRRPWWRRWW